MAANSLTKNFMDLKQKQLEISEKVNEVLIETLKLN